MSMRYKGGVISATPPTTSQTSASGSWTLSQQMQATGGGNWPVNGPFYIEDVFSTWLYTGNGSTQTINNGIDLAGEGGLVWLKSRSVSGNNWTQDSVRGVNSVLYPNLTNAAGNPAGTAVSSFNTNGFSLGTNTNINNSGDTYASWTFRKQPKFFDVVTYTGNGSSSQVISHALGSVPGCVIIKRTDSTSDWYVYHRGHEFAPSEGLALNLTASGTSTYRALLDVPTSTTFSAYIANTNTNGATYVAYIFAHNAGGFGLTGTDNVISCGSYTGNGLIAGPVIDLGYEPQWVLVKRTNATGNWQLQDNMRSLSQTNTDILFPNLSNAATTGAYPSVVPTATGFYIGDNGTGYNANGGTYIYIAIRRGPMKVPTTGTSVFSPNAVSTDASPVTTNFPVDLSFESPRSGSSNIFAQDRLRGANRILYTYNTDAESTAGGSASNFASNTSVQPSIYGSGTSLIFWNFRRAPGFFDEVCYTGDGTEIRNINHNLAVIPEFIIVKSRSNSASWVATTQSLGDGRLIPNSSDAFEPATDGGRFSPANFTATTFRVGYDADVNQSGWTYVAYLFASAPGVSKVGSYTGTGATQTINCGFTGGARFVLIKRTDSTGDWYVWDSARGIVAGNDPYLLLNSTAAQVTNTDFIDTASTGFEISSTAPAAINASGGTFIFLAIA
jgi:hypothetical protein